MSEENNKGFGYKFIKRNTKDGILTETWYDDPNTNQRKLIKSKIQKEDKLFKIDPPNDHQETIRDDLGLFNMLNNFHKVEEKIKNGQKEVYQDGWSIAPIDHKIPEDIPHKQKENQLGFKWKSLREEEVDEKDDRK